MPIMPFKTTIITTTLPFFLGLLLLLLIISCNDGRIVNGSKAPDIQLNTPQNNSLSLSELQAQNKIVLLDFWASWCTPCRQSHPYMDSIYQKYKDQKIGDADGFTIYSVSLDDKKDNWLAAIQKDNISWPHHVNDPKGFGSEYVDSYQFEQLPTTYVIDERGIIIGKNITRNWLEYELKRRIKASN